MSNIQCDQLITDPIQSDRPRHEGGVKSMPDSGHACEQCSARCEACEGMTFAAWLPVFDDSGSGDWSRGESVSEGLFERPVVRAFLRGGGMVLDVAEVVAAGTAGLGEFSEGRKL
jgi:hypothetical protein